MAKSSTHPRSISVAIQIRDPGVTFANVYIFKHWKLTSEPAIMIGMDALGMLDTLIIDYRRHELQMRTAEELNSGRCFFRAIAPE